MRIRLTGTFWFFAVISIIIFAAFALPNILTTLEQKTDVLNAKKELKHIYQLQRLYRAQNGAYCSSLEDSNLAYDAINCRTDAFDFSIDLATQSSFQAAAYSNGIYSTKKQLFLYINQAGEITEVSLD